ncbi:hypothetical protein Y032_0043g731 [Ancylostoma ceylanicum]|uniref:Uncharacterized protein n=1 Tax=Ancylostoma ceylanicum TaxID=53326 RepID=A0A016UE99_9BILA|nr:hypothetical protein Y032_0043g731 [Ancylostoma ceylanicum]
MEHALMICWVLDTSTVEKLAIVRTQFHFAKMMVPVKIEPLHVSQPDTSVLAIGNSIFGLFIARNVQMEATDCSTGISFYRNDCTGGDRTLGPASVYFVFCRIKV